jgi:hypothetical protein
MRDWSSTLTIAYLSHARSHANLRVHTCTRARARVHVHVHSGEALVGNEAVDQLTKFNQALADHSSLQESVHHLTPPHTTSHHATPRHITSHAHATSRHATPRHATPRHTLASPRPGRCPFVLARMGKLQHHRAVSGGTVPCQVVCFRGCVELQYHRAVSGGLLTRLLG